MSKSTLVVYFAIVTLGGCGGPVLDPTVVTFLDKEVPVPTCAAGWGELQNAKSDGRDGRSLAIEFPVTKSCAQEWWKSLEQDVRFKCERTVEYNTCTRGEIVPGQERLIVMPRENDVLVVWKAGKEPVMFGPKYV